MSILDEGEHQRLQAAIGDAERLFLNGSKVPDANLATGIESKKQRVQALEEGGVFGHDSSERRKSDSATAVAIATMAARESALTHTERQTYAGFLHRDYFTNNDIAKLEDFYADQGAFDRLSKKGKDEMTIRTLEGFQNGKLDEEKLSPNFMNKHTKHLGLMMKDEPLHPKIAEIPAATREAFVREYESGDIVAANAVLSGEDSFDSLSEKESQPASDRRVEAVERDEISEVAQDNQGKIESEDRQRSTPDEDFFASLEKGTAVKPSDLPSPPSEISRT